MIDNVSKDIVRDVLDSVIEELETLPVYPSLVWLWTWDCIKAAYDGDNLTPVFDKFWETADAEGWTMEYGSEHMSDHVTDWLIRNDFYNEEEE